MVKVKLFEPIAHGKALDSGKSAAFPLLNFLLSLQLLYSGVALNPYKLFIEIRFQKSIFRKLCNSVNLVCLKHFLHDLLDIFRLKHLPYLVWIAPVSSLLL